MKKIFIVEDDVHIRQILSIYLGREYGVELFSCGEKALKYFGKSKPDLVLLDIGLQGMSGLEVCQKLREINREIPIVFMSARRDGQKMAERIGVNDYFTKPINFDELLKCVSQKLKG